MIQGRYDSPRKPERPKFSNASPNFRTAGPTGRKIYAYKPKRIAPLKTGFVSSEYSTGSNLSSNKDRHCFQPALPNKKNKRSRTCNPPLDLRNGTEIENDRSEHFSIREIAKKRGEDKRPSDTLRFRRYRNSSVRPHYKTFRSVLEHPAKRFFQKRERPFSKSRSGRKRISIENNPFPHDENKARVIADGKTADCEYGAFRQLRTEKIEEFIFERKAAESFMHRRPDRCKASESASFPNRNRGAAARNTDSILAACVARSAHRWTS